MIRSITYWKPNKPVHQLTQIKTKKNPTLTTLPPLFQNMFLCITTGDVLLELWSSKLLTRGKSLEESKLSFSAGGFLIFKSSVLGVWRVPRSHLQVCHESLPRDSSLKRRFYCNSYHFLIQKISVYKLIQSWNKKNFWTLTDNYIFKRLL